MKKLLLATLILVISFSKTNAQAPDGFQFGAGIRLGLPVGDFSDVSSFGVGGELQGEIGISDKFSAILTSGYTNFFGKKIDIGGTEIKLDATGYIPILAGVRVYPSENFFIGGQLGYGILTGGGDSEGAFNYQPQIGYNSEMVQVALNYNGLSKNGSTLGHIGLTAIFKIGASGGGKK